MRPCAVTNLERKKRLRACLKTVREGGRGGRRGRGERRRGKIILFFKIKYVRVKYWLDQLRVAPKLVPLGVLDLGQGLVNREDAGDLLVAAELEGRDVGGGVAVGHLDFVVVLAQLACKEKEKKHC